MWSRALDVDDAVHMILHIVLGPSELLPCQCLSLLPDSAME